MANRRMFSKEIIDSDMFLDMPLSTQSLYFHLSMRADDDGFINNPKKIQRMIGASDDDVKILLAKNFILSFESGVIVIKHWKMHNYIQKDRYRKTNYTEELSKLGIKDNGAYTLDTECIQDGYSGKVRLGEDSIGKVSKEKKRDNKQILLDKFKKESSYSDDVYTYVEDFINYRSEIKKPLKTIAPIKSFIKELTNLNQVNYISWDYAIQLMKEREWQTVKQEWVANIQNKPQYKQNKGTSRDLIEEALKVPSSQNIEDCEIIDE